MPQLSEDPTTARLLDRRTVLTFGAALAAVPALGFAAESEPAPPCLANPDAAKAARLLKLQAAFALVEAVAEIDSNSRPQGRWHDTSHEHRDDEYGEPDDDYADNAMAAAIEYLDLLGYIRFHPTQPRWVQIIEIAECLLYPFENPL